MAPLRTDSPLSRRIVLSFLHFLNSVEVAPGVDSEGLEVAAQCLSDVFQLDGLHSDQSLQIPSLPHLFTSGPADADTAAAARRNSQAATPDNALDATGGDRRPSRTESLAHEEDTRPNGQASHHQGDGPSVGSLFEQFAEGLENAGHFDGLAKGGSEYMKRLHDARRTLEEALKAQNKAPSPADKSNIEVQAVAEAYKIQGNTAMAAKRYHEAIELYTLAISLCGNNAIYFANRAAAHTHIGKFEEAIGDCKTAIKLNPSYSKGYSRLGTAYFAQGRYKEAIENGFKRALELEPSNDSVRSSLQAAQAKLDDEGLHGERQQQQQYASSSGQGAGDSNGAAPGFSGSFPGFNGSIPGLGGGAIPNLPSEMANLFPGLLNLAAQFGEGGLDEVRRNGASAENRAAGGEDATGARPSQPNSNPYVDGNINLTFEGGQAPPQLNALVQSVMQWLGGPHAQNGSAAATAPDAHPGGARTTSESQ